MQGNQRRLAFKTFAVRRVADNGPVRAFWQRIAELGNIFRFKCNQFADARATGVAARAFNNPRVDIGTVEAGDDQF